MKYRKYDFREIITKAVCGKGRKKTTEINRVLPAHKPSSVLSCWIINHSYHATKADGEYVEIQGSYDINLWYAYDDHRHTEVVLDTVQYRDEIILAERDDEIVGEEYDCIAKVVKQPNCIQCQIAESGEEIEVEVEREFIVKLIGETKVNVKVEPIHSVQLKTDSQYKEKKHPTILKRKDG